MRPPERAAEAFVALDEAVFVTKGFAVCGEFTMTIGLVSVGREEDVVFVVLSVAGATACGFVGWLDMVLTTRSRCWATAEPLKLMAASAKQTDTKRTFLKFINYKLQFVAY